MYIFKKVLFVFLVVFSLQVSGQKKPNILWITIEDTSPQFIGCYGNKDASTPNIDQLAKEGIRFSNAFSTGTVCSPSRSTLITGVRTYEMGTGNHRSSYPIPDFIHGFPFYMKQAGYYTTNNSKTDYNIKSRKQLIIDAWDDCSNTASWENRKNGQPFFAVFNYMDSHQSRTMTVPYPNYIRQVINKLSVADRISENDFAMPPFYRDSPAMRKQFARVYNAIKLTDNKIGELLAKLEKDNLRDSTIIFFFADHGEGIPRGKTNGINLGYRVPFIIWFPEMYKHLSPWGKAGIVSDELIDFEDLAPTMIDLAGGKAPSYLKGRVLIGENRSKLVDHLLLSSDRSDNGPDLVRSITDGNYMYSRNYMPFMPEARYILYMETADIKKEMRKDLAEGKLNNLQKSLFNDRPDEFLFDISKDPWETNNLIAKPESQSVLTKMRQNLDQSILASRDVMFLPEYEIGLLSKKTTAYQYRLDDSNYSINSIYKAASLSGKRGASIAGQQVELLSDKNKIVRYWAALGLMSQPLEVVKPFKSKILAAINDNYPPAASTISAVAYKNFESDEAVRNLNKYILDGNEDLNLMTVNYLIYIQNKTPFMESVKTMIEKENLSYHVKSSGLCFMENFDTVRDSE